MESKQPRPDGSEVNVLFCKHSTLDGLKGDISYTLCNAINNVNKYQALGAQKLKTVWVILVRSQETKTKLLANGITIDDIHVKMYSENPYEVDLECDTERIVFKDLPLWEPNSLISEFIKNQPQLKPTSGVMSSKARNNATNRSSNFLNGDRYVYVQSGFKTPLPAKVKIGNHTCRIWRPTKQLKCLRCAATDHKTVDTRSCPAYVPKLNDILVFTRGILSNFDKCAVQMDDMNFVTAEHAYQWRACTENLQYDLAEKVYSARSPMDAKKLAAEVKDNNPNSHWNVIKYDVMRQVLQAKLDSNPSFQKALLETGDQKLVEGREDMCWGSGLPFNLTITTDPKYWPGSNKLGSILESLRAKLRSSDSVVTPGAVDISSPAVPDVTAGALDISAPAVPDVTTAKSRGRTIKKVSSIQRRSSAPSSTRPKKVETPLIKSFLTQRTKRQKRELTPSDDSDMDASSEASFTSTRDQLEEPPNDISDFASTDPDTIDNR